MKKKQGSKPEKKETPIQRITREVKRRKLKKDLIEIIFLLILIIYMLRDLYLDGELDFLFK